MALAAASATGASAQARTPTVAPDSLVEATPPAVRFSGLAYLDYAYMLASPDEEEEGANTFDYRRIYLTANYVLNDEFSGRVRLEMGTGSTTAQGRPSPFVKDAYIRWNGPFAEGHRLTLGVQPPPLFEVAEGTWGYRSLDRTLLDRTRANDSRDFGLRADGRILPERRLSYSLMVANGRGVRAEDDGQRGKHVYAQLQSRPTPTTRATLGVDYTPHEGDGEPRDETIKATAFFGSVTESFRAGVEAFYANTTFVDDALPEASGVGVSVFGIAEFGENDQYRAIARYDWVEAGARRSATNEHYALVALSYAPLSNVEIMPNLVYQQFEEQDAELQGRLTVFVRFRP